MKTTELLKAIIISLVENGEVVQVQESRDNLGVLLTIHADQSELGKIIGREGSIIHSIRSVIRAAGMREGARVSVRIYEPETYSRYEKQT